MALQENTRWIKGLDFIIKLYITIRKTGYRAIFIKENERYRQIQTNELEVFVNEVWGKSN